MYLFVLAQPFSQRSNYVSLLIQVLISQLIFSAAFDQIKTLPINRYVARDVFLSSKRG